MFNMVYLTHKHFHLKFGPKNRAISYIRSDVHYNQCFEERASHARFEPTHRSTNLILYRLTILALLKLVKNAEYFI